MHSLKTAAFPVLLTSVLALFLVVGCADQPAGPVIDPAGAAPMANFINGPATPGPYIIREEGNPVGFFFAEAATGRQVLVGNDPRLICTGGNPRDFVQIQTNMPPGAAAQVKDLIQGQDMLGQVWDFPNFNCGLYLTETPLVEGIVNLTSNNRIEFLSGNVPQFSGFNVHGAFNAHLRCHEDRQAGDVKCNASIVIP